MDCISLKSIAWSQVNDICIVLEHALDSLFRKTTNYSQLQISHCVVTIYDHNCTLFHSNFLAIEQQQKPWHQRFLFN